MLFFPVIWGLSALVAPAVNMPDKAETVGDLLNVLRDADKMSVQEARMVLEQMPIPENASIPFSKFIRVVRSVVLAVKSTTPIPEHERLRIYQEIEQLDASFCFLFYNFEFCEARENENGAETEVETILALAHLVNGNKASQYILRYDDALKADAEAHPETARIICILRFFTMDYALRTFGGETPEDELELGNRLLEVVQTTLPGMLSEKEMAFHKACAEQKYVEARWRQRRSVARAKLRSNGIAAGGYVIDFEKDAE